MSDILSICCGCGSLRGAGGHWNRSADFRRLVPSNRLSHGICADCIQRLYPEFAETLAQRRNARMTSAPRSASSAH